MAKASTFCTQNPSSAAREMSLLGFPVEIWQLVVRRLDVHDILALRAVNSVLRESLGSREVWLTLCHRRWFDRDDIDVHTLDPIDDLIAYYKRRHVQDHQAQQRIQSEDFSLEDGWAIVAVGEEMIPLMLSLRKSTANLYTRYVATSILEAIRRMQSAQSLHKFLFGPEEALIENVYYQCSRLDRAYDVLLPYRKRVLTDVEMSVRRDPRFVDCHGNPTAVVVLVVEHLFRRIKRCVGAAYEHESLDNLSILRHYAGEVGTGSLVQISMIQYIATFFSVSCQLSGTFVIVSDESYKGGKSYVSLQSGSFTPRVYSLMDVIKAVRRTNPGSAESALKTLTTPVKVVPFFESIIEFQSSDAIVRDAAMKESIADYATTYPISKIHVETAIPAYFHTCYRAEMKMKPCETSLRQLALAFPFDAAFIQDGLPHSLDMDLKSIARENFLRTPSRPNVHVYTGPTEFKLGQAVIHSSGVCSVICGVYVYAHEFIRDGASQVFYHLLNGLDVVSARIKLVEEVDEAQLRALLHSYDLGVYFTHWDTKRCCFVPHERLKLGYGWR